MTDPAPPAKKRGGGRATLLTPEVEKIILGAISVGDSDLNACACAGIASSTFYLWQEKAKAGKSPYLEFSENLTRARAEFRRNHLAMIAKAAQGTATTPGDWRASKYILAVRHPDEFSERVINEQRMSGSTSQTVTVSGAVAVAVVDADGLEKLSLAQLRALAGRPPEPGDEE